MQRNSPPRSVRAALALVTAFTAGSVSAHVSLVQPTAAAGATYTASLRVSHGCDGSATKALAVQVPAGLHGAVPIAKAGWSVAVERSRTTGSSGGPRGRGRQEPDEIRWTADSPASWLPAKEAGEFSLRAKAGGATGPQWFRVTQTCDKGEAHWTEIPAQGTATDGLKSPAVLLNVVAAGTPVPPAPLVRVERAWVRAALPGQPSSGGYMRLTALEDSKLVGISTPAAGTAELHEMRMDGDVMRMRAVASLPLPAGKPIELAPGGWHIMLTELRRPLQVDSTVPITLWVLNAQGRRSRIDVQAPVQAAAAGGTAAHKH